jgi:hypothetical protein
LIIEASRQKKAIGFQQRATQTLLGSIVMTWSQHWFRSNRFGCSGGDKRRRSPRAQLLVEGLETRLVPASVFVVPASQIVDATTHFHTLADAITAAGSGGLVTIEPGASPDPTQPINVPSSQSGLTIQGDPNVPASILPEEQLTVDGAATTLTNLNLGSLSLDGDSSGDTVSKCLIVSLSEFARASSLTQNTITGSAVVQPRVFVFPSNGSVLIVNNTFTSVGAPLLTITACTGVTVTGNTFSSGDILNPIILVKDAGTSGAPITIANNTLAVTGLGAFASDLAAIRVFEDTNGADFVRILNNALSTENFGIGLDLEVAIGHTQNFNVLVQGNDFHNNSIGVRITGDAGIPRANIDMGLGSLGSLGGNDFRGFNTLNNHPNAVDVLSPANVTSVIMGHNVFDSGLDTSTVLFGAAFEDSGLTLDNGRAFVQTLYNNLLGRTGALAELDPWVQMLNSQGQAAVANAILHSSEALGRIVDSFYLRFLGRQSDAAGRAGWIAFLQHAGTEEQMESLFLTSPEYISHINTDFVQSLYLNILGRSGSPAELAQWNNNIQNVGGLAGVANAFVHSTENRLNTLRSDFQTLVHRTPADGELIPLVNGPQDLLSLEAQVLSGSEFFANG